MITGAAVNSGTINDKVGFARQAIAKLTKLEDLSLEAEKLCERIYAFVKSHNP
jgi:hypothetical protein